MLEAFSSGAALLRGVDADDDGGGEITTLSGEGDDSEGAMSTSWAILAFGDGSGTPALLAALEGPLVSGFLSSVLVTTGSC